MIEQIEQPRKDGLASAVLGQSMALPARTRADEVSRVLAGDIGWVTAGTDRTIIFPDKLHATAIVYVAAPDIVLLRSRRSAPMQSRTTQHRHGPIKLRAVFNFGSKRPISAPDGGK